MFYTEPKGAIMQYVPRDLPPPHPPDERGTQRVVPMQAAKDVISPPIAPIAFNFKPQEKRRRAPAVATAHVFKERGEEERRKYCRRLHNTAILYDLRVVIDRRKRNQRKSDLTTSVDEIV